MKSSLRFVVAVTTEELVTTVKAALRLDQFIKRWWRRRWRGIRRNRSSNNSRPKQNPNQIPATGQHGWRPPDERERKRRKRAR